MLATLRPNLNICQWKPKSESKTMVDVKINWTLGIGEVRKPRLPGGVPFLGLWFVKMFTYFLRLP